MHKNQKRFLIIQLRQLGDILLTTPMISLLKKIYPGCSVSFLSHSMGRKILEGHPYLDELITYHESDSIVQQWQMLKKLRANKYDAVFDYMNNPRSALYTFFLGSDAKVSFESSRRFFYDHIESKPKKDMYIVDEKATLIEQYAKNEGVANLSTLSTSKMLQIPWGADELLPFKSFCEQNPGYKDAKYRIVLSPTHRRERRKWSKKSYMDLAEKLNKLFPEKMAITWVWGPGEEHEIDELITECNVPTFKSPHMTLKELTAFITQNDMFIGNSNGPSHLAVAANILSIQLHGHTKGISWCPPRKEHRYLQCHGENLMDLEQIAVSDVVKVFEEQMDLIESRVQKRQALVLIEDWQAAQSLFYQINH